METIRFIQAFSSDFLDQFFIYVTMMGEEYFFMSIVCLFYWCIDKRFGYKLGFAYLSNGVFNTGLKHLFKVPRPFVKDPSLRVLRLETAGGYSFPSGHTQFTAAFWTTMALEFKKKWIYPLGFVLIVLVGLSRMYLGLHTPIDVLVGAALGIGWVFLSNALFEAAERTGRKTWLLILVIPAVIGMFFFREENYFKVVGTFTGFYVGYLIESRWIRFDVKASWWMQALKIILGLAVLLLLKSGIKLILPESIISDFARYFLMVIWVTVAAPLIFKPLARFCGSSAKDTTDTTDTPIARDP